MPLYMIERTLAERAELSGEDVALMDEVNADEGVHWVFSFLTADQRRTYCLYEAPSPDAIRRAAGRLDLPADSIVEVGPMTPELASRLEGWAARIPTTAEPGARTR